MNNIEQILTYSYGICFLLIFPLAACLLFDKFKRFSCCVRMLIAIPLYSILSWLCVNGFIWLRYLINPMSLRGPEGAFALFFGWLYLWITSIPVFLLYRFVRAVYLTVKKNKELL